MITRINLQPALFYGTFATVLPFGFKLSTGVSLVFYMFLMFLCSARAFLYMQNREKREIKLKKREIKLKKREIKLKKREIKLKKREKNTTSNS